MSVIIEHDSENAVFKGDQWTPKLHGDIFCSPACGGRCKKVDYNRATELASRIASQMGRGWTPRIWENLGWHFEVNKDCATISPDRNGQYRASIHFSIIDMMNSSITETDSDPRVAMQRAIEVLNDKVSKLKRTLTSVSLEPLEIKVL